MTEFSVDAHDLNVCNTAKAALYPAMQPLAPLPVYGPETARRLARIDELERLGKVAPAWADERRRVIPTEGWDTPLGKCVMGAEHDIHADGVCWVCGIAPTLRGELPPVASITDEQWDSHSMFCKCHECNW